MTKVLVKKLNIRMDSSRVYYVKGDPLTIVSKRKNTVEPERVEERTNIPRDGSYLYFVKKGELMKAKLARRY